MLLAQAKVVWAASPNNIGAKNASCFLRLIDPNSKSGAGAQILISEIKKLPAPIMSLNMWESIMMIWQLKPHILTRQNKLELPTVEGNNLQRLILHG